MENRRVFLKKAAAVGWSIPLITTVLKSECRAGLSGYVSENPPNNVGPTPRPRRKTRPWWYRFFYNSRKHHRG